ncbi:MAG: hypothetical protein FJ279_26335 [Planctomycetes bacterium]|nr:hypothetical protein [Planctomycetota bacterium]
MLAEPFEKHFTLERVKLALPPAAEIRRSILCAQCGEPTMATRIRRTANRRVCIPCARLHREKAGSQTDVDRARRRTRRRSF